MHTRSVHLVLSLKTGLVLPQFHVTFDNYFETTKWENYMPRSQWQEKARLIKPAASDKSHIDPIDQKRQTELKLGSGP